MYVWMYVCMNDWGIINNFYDSPSPTVSKISHHPIRENSWEIVSTSIGFWLELELIDNFSFKGLISLDTSNGVSCSE